MYNEDLGSFRDEIRLLLGFAAKVAESLKTQNASSTELEIELRLSDPSLNDKSMPQAWWELLLRRLKATNLPRVHTIDTVQTKSAPQDSSLSYRCIQEGSKHTYQIKQRCKKKDGSHVLCDFPIISSISTTKRLMVRIAACEEIAITQDQWDRASAHLTKYAARKRDRYSFFWPSKDPETVQYVIDMTKVTFEDSNQVTYNVEVEFKNLPWKINTVRAPDGTNRTVVDKSVVESFFQRFRKSFGILFPTLHTLYAPQQYAMFASLLPGRGKAPINIQEMHLQQGLYDYYVTNKLDGIAYSLFVVFDKVNNTLCLVLKNDSDSWLLKKEKVTENDALKVLMPYAGSETRVEVVENKNQGVSIFMFDVISYNGSLPNKNFTDRIKIMSHLLMCINTMSWSSESSLKKYMFYVKTFYKSYDHNIKEDIVKTLKDLSGMYPLMEDIVYKNDGIIFQPNILHSTDAQSWKTTALKWKFYKHISIDFKLQKVQTNSLHTTYSLLVSNDQPFYQKTITVNNNQAYDGVAGIDLHDLIVECVGQIEPNANTVFYKINKIRWDKLKPNAFKVAVDTEEDIKNELTLPWLIQKIQKTRSMISCHTVALKHSLSSNDLVIMAPKEHDRTRLFPDANIVFNQRITSKSLACMMNSKESSEIAKLVREKLSSLKVFVDATAGVGGMTLAFAQHLKNCSIVSIEENKLCHDALLQNIQLYSYNKIITAQGDALANIPLLSSLYKTIDAVFVDYLGLMKFSNLTDMSIGLNNQPILSNIQTLLQHSSVVVIHVDSSFPKDQLVSSLEFNVEYKSIKDHKTHQMSTIYFIFKQGFAMKQMRNFNNLLKQQLITDWCYQKDVLDLGSGKGGDLLKYSKSQVNCLKCVEPDTHFADEMEARIRNNPQHFKSMKINIIRSKAESLQLPPGTKFPVISLFFVLTFFFKSATLLNKLLDVINNYLADHGVLIGTTMIGSELRQKLSVSPHSLETQLFKIEQTMWGDSSFGNEIVIDLKNTQTATSQCEYLVDFNMFCQMLADRGIYLSHTQYVDVSNMNEDEAFIASKNIGFVFLKKQRPLNPSLPIPMGSFDVGGLVNKNSWMLFNNGFENSFYHTLSLSLHVEESLRDFVYFGKPYQLPSIHQDVEELRNSIEASFTYELYASHQISRLNVLQLRNVPSHLVESYTLICLNWSDYLKQHNLTDAYHQAIDESIATNLLELFSSLRHLNAQVESFDLEFARYTYVQFLITQQRLATNDVLYDKMLLSIIGQILACNVQICHINQEHQVVEIVYDCPVYEHQDLQICPANLCLANINNIQFGLICESSETPLHL